jgi:hypothetical protein
MATPGLTLAHVKSHLQRWRLVRRAGGTSIALVVGANSGLPLAGSAASTGSGCVTSGGGAAPGLQSAPPRARAAAVAAAAAAAAAAAGAETGPCDGSGESPVSACRTRRTRWPASAAAVGPVAAVAAAEAAQTQASDGSCKDCPAEPQEGPGGPARAKTAAATSAAAPAAAPAAEPPRASALRACTPLAARSACTGPAPAPGVAAQLLLGGSGPADAPMAGEPLVQLPGAPSMQQLLLLRLGLLQQQQQQQQPPQEEEQEEYQQQPPLLPPPPLPPQPDPAGEAPTMSREAVECLFSQLSGMLAAQHAAAAPPLPPPPPFDFQALAGTLCCQPSPPLAAATIVQLQQAQPLALQRPAPGAGPAGPSGIGAEGPAAAEHAGGLIASLLATVAGPNAGPEAASALLQRLPPALHAEIEAALAVQARIKAQLEECTQVWLVSGCTKGQGPTFQPALDDANCQGPLP